MVGSEKFKLDKKKIKKLVKFAHWKSLNNNIERAVSAEAQDAFLTSSS